MSRTSAITDVEKHLTINEEEAFARFLREVIFLHKLNFVVQFGKKKSFEKNDLISHRCLANHVFARPGREKRPNNSRTPKGAKANPIKHV